MQRHETFRPTVREGDKIETTFTACADWAMFTFQQTAGVEPATFNRFRLTLYDVVIFSIRLAKFGFGSRCRTSISSFKAKRPAIRRTRNKLKSKPHFAIRNPQSKVALARIERATTRLWDVRSANWATKPYIKEIGSEGLEPSTNCV